MGTRLIRKRKASSIMSLMHRGGYVARISYDEEIDSFFGEVINTSDVMIDSCRAKGVEPSRPYSGKFNVRLSPTEHARIAGAAAAAGKSMNAWIADILAEAAERTLTG